MPAKAVKFGVGVKRFWEKNSRPGPCGVCWLHAHSRPIQVSTYGKI